MSTQPNRGGRPPLPAGERMIPIPLRLSEEIIQRADAVSARSGMTRSAVLRDWIAKGSRRHRQPVTSTE